MRTKDESDMEMHARLDKENSYLHQLQEKLQAPRKLYLIVVPNKLVSIA